ncbi:Leucine-rich repeat-containing protein 56 [Taenia solium]|eukprot:TsM_000328500 transcript=TsM_000328500 gene=TsM_000328500
MNEVLGSEASSPNSKVDLLGEMEENLEDDSSPADLTEGSPQQQSEADNENVDGDPLKNTNTLSANRLKDLTQHADLEDVDYLEMCIDVNKLRIDNLGELLPNLKCLKLSKGILPQIRDIGLGFGKLEIMWMSQCCLHSLEGLDKMREVRELYLAFNDISDICPLGNLTKLEILDLEGNKIHEKQSIEILSGCTCLSNLTLEGNPVIKQFKSYSNYWMHVKELLPSLKCLDNITTESTRAQRDVQNECDFDDEWAYINRVIDEFASAPYKVSIESDFEKKTSAIGAQKSSGNSSLFSVNKPISLIYLTPDEKRQRVRIDEDGTIRDHSDSKEIRKWAESLPKIKPVSTNLTSGSVICGNIGKALRQRRNSICTPIPSNSNDIKKAKPEAECEKEGIDFDGETEATIIEGLQNDKPRKYTTPSFRIPKESNANCSERFTSRARQKPRALANVRQPTSTTTLLKEPNSDQLTDHSKYPDAESQITHIELERVKLRPVLRGKPGRAQSEVPRCKPPPPNEANFPPSRKTLVPNSLQKRPMKDSTQRPNIANKPGVQTQQTLISLKPC